MKKFKEEWLYTVFDKLLIAMIIAVSVLLFKNFTDDNIKKAEYYKTTLNTISSLNSNRMQLLMENYRSAYFDLTKAVNVTSMTQKRFSDQTAKLIESLEALNEMAVRIGYVKEGENSDLNEVLKISHDFRNTFKEAKDRDGVFSQTFVYLFAYRENFRKFDKFIDEMIIKQVEIDIETADKNFSRSYPNILSIVFGRDRIVTK